MDAALSNTITKITSENADVVLDYVDSVLERHKVFSVFYTTRILKEEDLNLKLSILTEKTLFSIFVTRERVFTKTWAHSEISSVSTFLNFDRSSKTEDIGTKIYRFSIILNTKGGEKIRIQTEGDLEAITKLKNHAEKIREVL